MLAGMDVLIVSTVVIIDAIVTGVQRHSFSLAVWSGQCLLGAQSQHCRPHRAVENLKMMQIKALTQAPAPGRIVRPLMGSYTTRACDI